MRVSTNQIYDAGALGIQQNHSALFKLNNQLSTGRRVLTPQDDPVAAAQALVVTQSKEVNQQYLNNQGQAKHQMALVDSHMSSIVNLLNNVREKVIQAGNAALTQPDRAAIAAEVDERLSELVGIANSDNGVGEYLFSGYSGNVRPFGIDTSKEPVSPSIAPPFAYSGDDGERLLQVSSSRQMSISVSGSELFMMPKQGNGTFVTATGGTVGVGARGATATAEAAITDRTQWNSAISDVNANLPLTLEFQENAGTLQYRITDSTSASTAWANYTANTPIPVANANPLDFGAQITISGTPVAGQHFTINANTGLNPSTITVARQEPVAPATPAVSNGGSILNRALFEAVIKNPNARLPLELRFVDNSGTLSYQIVDSTGAATTLADFPAGGVIPLINEFGLDFGATVTITGTPVPGDSFRIRPGFNQGSALMDIGSVKDPQKWAAAINNPAVGKPLEIHFQNGPDGKLQYGIFDPINGLSGLRNYADGQAIPLIKNGVDFGAQVMITGTPVAGDTFTIKASESQSMFQTLQNLLGVLKNPVGEASYTRTQYMGDLNAELANLDQALGNVSRIQSNLGVQQQELESLQTTLSDLDIQYQSNLSELQDLDYYKAISDFIKQQINLEAAQKSFAQISGLSLFKYL